MSLIIYYTKDGEDEDSLICSKYSTDDYLDDNCKFNRKSRVVTILARNGKVGDLISFLQFPNIKNIDIDKCSFGFIPELNLPKLCYLSIMNAGLYDISKIKFDKLYELNLSHNQLTTLKGIENLSNLRNLIIEDNKLTKLPRFKNNPKLTEITCDEIDTVNVNRYKIKVSCRNSSKFQNYQERLKISVKIIRLLVLKNKIKNLWNSFLFDKTNKDGISRFAFLSLE